MTEIQRHDAQCKQPEGTMLKPVYKKMNIFWGPNNNRETAENKNGKKTPMVNVKKRY